MIEVAGRQPLVEPVRVTPDYGKFVVEPLPHGYGVTVGNALRRVLLSSIPGVAIVTATIEGCDHEFRAIEGVQEDVTEFILNLKEVAFQVVQPHLVALDTPRRWQGQIVAEGSGEVTAADLVVPGDIEVVNPELHLATLTTDQARLSVEFEIETGIGYVPADKHEREGRGVGVIPVDSLFTPVQRVNHLVESTRVGHQTDLDRLVIEVWTNGAMTPPNALSAAARLLDGYFRLFFDFRAEPTDESAEGEHPGEAERGRREVLDAKIEDLDFSVRTYNCLKKENINTIGELMQFTQRQLLEIRNLGQKSLDEIVEKLAERELTLDEDEE